jgi:hypothetical protein
VTAAATPEHGFLAVTAPGPGPGPGPEGEPFAYGFLRRQGRTVPLAGGERTVERDPDQGWITAIRMEGTDAEGRPLEAVGTPVSRMIIERHTFIDINSLLRWDLNGEEAWGEDQDMWPVHTWSARRREARARA